MDFKEIELADKKIFDEYINKSGLKASEYSFTNFFMWRKYYRAKFTVLEGYLFVLANPEFGKPFLFMPMGSLNIESLSIALQKLKKYFDDKDMRILLSRIEEEYTQVFKSIMDFRVEFDRDNSDYVYSTYDLMELTGKKYNKKRNHLNAFLKKHRYEYYKVNSELIEDCIHIMEEWCERRDCDCVRGEYCERHANEEVLKNFKSLDITGGIVKVDDKFEAFSIGEKMNNSAIIHIEKANDNIRGLFNIINRDYIKNELRDTEFINREQDLGQEGLRKAKLSYRPSHLINKYNLYL